MELNTVPRAGLEPPQLPVPGPVPGALNNSATAGTSLTRKNDMILRTYQQNCSKSVISEDGCFALLPGHYSLTVLGNGIGPEPRLAGCNTVAY